MQITVTENIDKLLKVLLGQQLSLSKNEISNKLKTEINIQESELNTILAKAIKDEYIHEFRHGSMISHTYKLTFDGILFINEGGYTSQASSRRLNQELEKNQRDLQKTQTEMITAQAKIMERQTQIQQSVKTLTVWIAIGTVIAAIYYIFELVNHIKNLFR